jgi:hypothetical protein
MGIMAALLALVAVAAPAGAMARPARPSFTVFHVVYEGSGSYGVKSTGEKFSAQESATFHWKVAYSPLLVISKAGATVGTASLPGRSSGGGEWSISVQNDEESCSGHGALKLAKLGGITGQVQPSGKLPLKLTPGDSDFLTEGGSGGSGPCVTGDFWHDWVLGFSHIGSGEIEDLDPLTAFVTLNRSDLKAGKVVANVSNSTLAAPSLSPDADCGSGDGTTCTQSFNWSGRVTLVRSGHHGHKRH